MAKQQCRERVRRESVKRNISHGQAHIKASFNNTIITITDQSGDVVVLDLGWIGRLQGLAQVDALCGPGRCRGGGPPGR